jgi:TatA/E family protein of Tat protein translocase
MPLFGRPVDHVGVVVISQQESQLSTEYSFLNLVMFIIFLPESPMIWLLIVGVIFLLFGGSKLPQLAKALGQSKRSFKGGLDEPEDKGQEQTKSPRKFRQRVTPRSRPSMIRQSLLANFRDRTLAACGSEPRHLHYKNLPFLTESLQYNPRPHPTIANPPSLGGKLPRSDGTVSPTGQGWVTSLE